MKFKFINEKEIIILDDNEKEIGHIYSPADYNKHKNNVLQVCGFSEAFDLWSCGDYKGFKDIQLLFDDKQLGGKYTDDFTKCCRCFREPCQCENKINKFPKGVDDLDYIQDLNESSNPFNVKRTEQLEHRFEDKK